MIRIGIGDILLWAVVNGILMATAGIITGLIFFMLRGEAWSGQSMGALFVIGQVWGIIGSTVAYTECLLCFVSIHY